MSMWARMSSQFGNPEGFLGKLAGSIMSRRESNIERINWAVDLLNPKASDNVLERGFGPGVTIQRMSEIVTLGIVYGVGRSNIMVAQARKRNQKGSASGRV